MARKRFSFFTLSVPLKGMHNGIAYIANRGFGEICTLQSTLGHFPDTPLAKKYTSKEWENSLDLDERGWVYEDHNSECFRKLVNVMRLRTMIRDLRKEEHKWRRPTPVSPALAPTMTKMLSYLIIDSLVFFGPLGEG